MILRAHSKSIVECWASNWSYSINWSDGRICSGNSIWSRNWSKFWTWTWCWAWGRGCSIIWSRKT
jgi:hypothetical protein